MGNLNSGIRIALPFADMPSKSNKELPKSLRIEGSATHALYEKYKATEIPLLVKEDSLFDAYRNLYYYGKGTEEDVARCVREMDDNRGNIFDAGVEFIRQHPDSPVAMHIARQLKVRSYTREKAREVAALFSEDMKATPAGQETMKTLLECPLYVGDMLPDFDVLTTELKTVKLSELLTKGHYTLVELWASWCGPCRSDIPHLKETYQRYHPEGFELISISIDDDTPEFRKLEEMRIKADMLQSIFYYPNYNGRNMFPANCTREEFIKIQNDFYLTQKDVVEPVLKELALSDANIDIEVARYVLSLYGDTKLFDFKISSRLEELQEGYYNAAKLNNKEIDPALYKEVSDYISTMKYEDFRDALSFRLERRAKLMEGRPAPDVELSDLQGNKKKLSDYKGKILYVDFWATWCAPCMAETPFFNALSQKYPNIQFIAISIDEKRDLWERAVKEGNHGKVVEYLSDDKDLRTKWDVIGIPRFLLIDENFNIINSSAPRPSEKASVEALLEKYNR